MTIQNEIIPCQQCGESLLPFAQPVVHAGVAYRVWFCASCGIGKTLPQPKNAIIHELHSTQYYRNGEGVRFAKPIEWLVEGMRRWRIHRLSKFVQTGRVLDIGCGGGRFLRAMQECGWDVAGVELNDETANSARMVHGLNVETSLEAFVDASFDLITITHVLEHVGDPGRMLADCTRLLKVGGVIAVGVPNIESWQAIATGGNWFHLDLPRHLWHFSEKWLTVTFRDLGYVPVAVRRLDLAHNIFGWMQSIFNLLGLRHNRFYSFLSSDDLETDKRSFYGALSVSLILVPLVFPLSVALAALESLFHAGGTVELVARLEKK